MKHVKEFIKIDESEDDDYIDIFNSDIKGQIMDILNQYKIDISSNDYPETEYGIREEDFDNIADELSKLE